MQKELETLLNKFDLTIEERRTKILSLLSAGANIRSVDYLNSLSDYEFLLDIGLNSKLVLKTILLEASAIAPIAKSYVLHEHIKDKIRYAAKFNLNFNAAFIEHVQNMNVRVRDNKETYYFILPLNLINFLHHEFSLNINLILEAGVLWNDFEIVEYAINRGANRYYSSRISANSILYNLFYTDRKLRNLITNNEQEINVKLYLDAVWKISFRTAVDLTEDYLQSLNYENIYEYYRSIGKSELEAIGLLDIFLLIQDFIMGENLSIDELAILNNKDIAEKKLELTNKYSFTGLHLAIIAKNYEVAKQLIMKGADIYAESNNKLSCINLIANIFEENQKNALIKLVAKDLKNIDADIGFGETLADRLLIDSRLNTQVIETSNDRLFYFLKHNYNLSILDEINKTNIAISHGEGFWSSGIFAFARSIRKKYNVEFFFA